MTISIDVEHLVSAIAAQLVEPLRSAIETVRSLGADPAPLQPLATILDLSTAAARMRLIRDPELRAVGLRVGRRVLFRRADVEALLAARMRENSR